MKHCNLNELMHSTDHTRNCLQALGPRLMIKARSVCMVSSFLRCGYSGFSLSAPRRLFSRLTVLLSRLTVLLYRLTVLLSRITPEGNPLEIEIHLSSSTQKSSIASTPLALFGCKDMALTFSGFRPRLAFSASGISASTGTG